MQGNREQGTGNEVATIRLSEDQVRQISEATGVNVSELSVLQVSDDAARAIHPSLVTGTLVVACW